MSGFSSHFFLVVTLSRGILDWRPINPKITFQAIFSAYATDSIKIFMKLRKQFPGSIWESSIFERKLITHIKNNVFTLCLSIAFVSPTVSSYRCRTGTWRGIRRLYRCWVGRLGGVGIWHSPKGIYLHVENKKGLLVWLQEYETRGYHALFNSFFMIITQVKASRKRNKGHQR